jgi:hypothetical protein
MGLEEYQGMTQDQKITVLLVKVDILTDEVRSRPACPSAQCQDHETRITTLEQRKENEKEMKLGFREWFGILIVAAISIASLALQFISMSRGG